MANLQTRNRKSRIDEPTLRQHWDRELAALGTSKEIILENARNAGRQLGHDRSHGMTAEDIVLTAAMALTETESTFGKGDILKSAAKLSIGQYRFSELETAFGTLADSKEVIQLAGKNSGYSGTYTSKEMYKIEKQLVSWIRNGAGKAEPLMAPEQAEKAIEAYVDAQKEQDANFNLTSSQKTAVKTILTSNSRYQVLQGAAGTGKSTAFSVLRHALSTYAQRDVELVGLSFTGKAAGELHKNSGIQSQTIASYLQASKDDSGTSNALSDDVQGKLEKIIIVDEATMLGSNDAYQLFRQVEKKQQKLILVGDVKQLLGVSSGKLFTDVQEKSIIDFSSMTEVLRQKTEHMKQVVADVTEKRVDAAFEKLEQHGKLHQIENRDELLSAITNDFASKPNWQQTLVITATNETRKELNDRIRQELQDQGKIGSEDVSLTIKSPKNLPAIDKYFAQNYRPGDYVFASQAGGGLRAGTEARVLHADQDNHTLTLADKEGNIKLFDLKEHGNRLSVYEEIQDFKLSSGEKILFAKNDRKLGVQNGLSGIVDHVDREGNIRVNTENGDQVSFNVNKHFGFIQRGYALSVYKSQGMTSDEVIYHLDSKDQSSNTLNAFYTGVTRGKHDAHIYTDNKEVIQQQTQHEQTKNSTLDYDKSLAELDSKARHEESENSWHSSEPLKEHLPEVDSNQRDLRAITEKEDVRENVTREAHTSTSKEYELSR